MPLATTELNLAAHNSRPMSAAKLKFTDLPIEILEKVFTHIPDRDIIKLEGVRNAPPMRDDLTLTSTPPVTCSRLVDHFEILFVDYQHFSIDMNSFSPVWPIIPATVLISTNVEGRVRSTCVDGHTQKDWSSLPSISRWDFGFRDGTGRF